ncbi:hypothetical protein BDV12DRAFT_9932 [Aspergillus spectabilis]
MAAAGTTLSNTIPGNGIDTTIFGDSLPVTESVTIFTIYPSTGDLGTTSFLFISSTVTVISYTTWPAPGTSSVVLQTITPQSLSESATESTTEAISSPTASETTAATSPGTATTSPGTATTSPGTATTSRTDSPVTPSASSTQTPRVGSSNSGSGIGTGALAGAIVGSVVGTALLTFLLAFLFFRRRRASPASGPVENLPQSPTKSGAFVRTSASSNEKPDGSFSLAAITPHPADDGTVRSKILTLIDHATLHVDNYYAPASHAPLSHDAVTGLAKYDTHYLPTSFAVVLEQQGSQRQTITHALVYSLLQAIGAGGQLLPQLLAAQPQVNNIITSSGNALFAWRMITAYLYDQSSQRRDATKMAARSQAARAFADEFSSAFSAYAQPAFSESDRAVHLSKLANSAAELGIWLFAQPCTFDFVWQKSSSEITVSPKVVKTFDERGARLAMPQVLIEPVQARYPGPV